MDYKIEISKYSWNGAMMYCRQAHIKIVASQSNKNPDKQRKHKIFLLYIHINSL